MPLKGSKSALPKTGIDAETIEKIQRADLANVVKKVQAGKPLTRAERELIENSKTAPQTLMELASILGISRQLLNHLKKKSDAPPVSDVAAWQIFIAANGRDGAAPSYLKRKLAEKRLSLLTTADSREKIKLGKDQDTVIDKSEVATALQGGMAMLFNQLEKVFCNDLPPSLAGKPPAEIAAMCRGAIEKLTAQLVERLGALAKNENA